jgi:hypothetical protein
MRRTIVLAFAFLAAAAAAAGVTAAVMRTPESNGVSCIERAMKLNAESFHDLDFGFQASAFIR